METPGTPAGSKTTSIKPVHGKFSDEEEAALRAAIGQYARERQLSPDNLEWLFDKNRRGDVYGSIYKACPTRTGTAVRQWLYTHLRPARVKGVWSESEVEQLRQFMTQQQKAGGRTKWVIIAEQLGRSHVDVFAQWQIVGLGENEGEVVKNKHWTEAEVAELEGLVRHQLPNQGYGDGGKQELRGTVDWDKVSTQLRSRTPTQCRLKWEHIRRDIESRQWDRTDELRLLHALHGGGYGDAKEVPWRILVNGRTGRTLKQRWESILDSGNHTGMSFQEIVAVLLSRFSPLDGDEGQVAAQAAAPPPATKKHQRASTPADQGQPAAACAAGRSAAQGQPAAGCVGAGADYRGVGGEGQASAGGSAAAVATHGWVRVVGHAGGGAADEAGAGGRGAKGQTEVMVGGGGRGSVWEGTARKEKIEKKKRRREVTAGEAEAQPGGQQGSGEEAEVQVGGEKKSKRKHDATGAGDARGAAGGRRGRGEEQGEVDAVEMAVGGDGGAGGTGTKKKRRREAAAAKARAAAKRRQGTGDETGVEERECQIKKRTKKKKSKTSGPEVIDLTSPGGNGQGAGPNDTVIPAKPDPVAAGSKWSEEEVARLLRKVRRQLDKKGGPRAGDQEVDWEKVAVKIKTHSAKECRKKWCKEQVRARQLEWPSGSSRKLIKALYRGGYRKEKKVPWDNLIAGRNADATQRQWQLLRATVPGQAFVRMKEVVQYLAHDFGLTPANSKAKPKFKSKVKLSGKDKSKVKVTDNDESKVKVKVKLPGKNKAKRERREGGEQQPKKKKVKG